MSVRVRYKLETAVSSTTAEEKDLGNRRYEVVSDGLNEGGSWKTRLLAGATDVNLSLRDVSSARLLVVSTNTVDPNELPGTIQIKRNSTGGEVIEIVPLPSSKQGHFMITTQGLTAIYASNPGTVNMEIVLAVAGD